MLKLISSLFLLTSISTYAASTRIDVELDGKIVSGLLYYSLMTNSQNGTNYLHLGNLRVRVSRNSFNVAPYSDIDEHICELLGHPYVNYRIQGGGGYEDADAYLVREDGKNVVHEMTGPSLDSITCASKPFSM